MTVFAFVMAGIGLAVGYKGQAWGMKNHKYVSMAAFLCAVVMYEVVYQVWEKPLNEARARIAAGDVIR
ncbi:MAG: hypothetical protein PHO89_01270 [Methylacidiphilaceae bacterium]|nr:hypothetical protein [Candidatus Methylacidiphilaceae bacterium]